MLSNAAYIETPAAAGVDGRSGLTVAELVELRQQEIDLFNATVFPVVDGGDAADAWAARTFGATTEALRDRPIETRTDATAVVEMLLRDDVFREPYDGAAVEVYENLLRQLRAYLERH